MKICDLTPTFSPDSDSSVEVIYFVRGNTSGLYYYKAQYSDVDFHGKPIRSTESSIRTRSIWFADLKDQTVREIVPRGAYDIEGTYLAGHYLYFVKIIDCDGDGLLLDDDYAAGQIWRVNTKTNLIEFCYDMSSYVFHGFEAANEQYVIFRSEDNLPDTTELVILDVVNHVESKIDIGGTENNDFDYRVIIDGSTPVYLVSKPWVDEGDAGSGSNTLNFYLWSDVLKQLKWEAYPRA